MRVIIDASNLYTTLIQLLETALQEGVSRGAAGDAAANQRHEEGEGNADGAGQGHAVRHPGCHRSRRLCQGLWRHLQL